MDSWIEAVNVYLALAIGIVLLYLLRHRGRDARARKILEEAIATGLTEPPSLHPVIDPALCIGCGSCVSACPEHGVLGLIRQKSVLVNPADCVGHGACETACPEHAITLVYGTATRGVDLPQLSPNYETTVPGIYVAGELGGMGLIKNAIEQGRLVMDNISAALSRNRSKEPFDWDCVIIGCGPAGLAASLQAQQKGIRALAFDRSSIGGTVAHFPRKKLVMTAPAVLPGYGKVRFREIYKEELIAFWHKVIAKHKPRMNENETLQNITRRRTSGFIVTSDKAKYKTRTVLLALGRRGTPRTLDVPGEVLSKVVYELDDPDQYAGDHVVVVGGGDSALEAAMSISECSPASVMLCYRGENFNRAKRKNRERLEDLASRRLLHVRYSTNVTHIKRDSVEIRRGDKVACIPNDHVIICVGGVLPTPFLKGIGIGISTKYGEK